MTTKRQPKKSESIEVRLSFEAKAAFMEKCASDGVTASEAIRSMIDDRTSLRHNAGTRALRRRTGLAVALGVVLGAGAAAPALAHANRIPRATFEQLDRNHDGVLTYDEYRGR